MLMCYVTQKLVSIAETPWTVLLDTKPQKPAACICTYALGAAVLLLLGLLDAVPVSLAVLRACSMAWPTFSMGRERRHGRALATAPFPCCRRTWFLLVWFCHNGIIAGVASCRQKARSKCSARELVGLRRPRRHAVQQLRTLDLAIL